MPITVDRWARRVAAATASLAALAFVWLAFVPSGMDTLFGEDEFDPFSGFVLLALTAILCIGMLEGSRRMTWGGLALAGLALLFWVWVMTATQIRVAGLFVMLYALSAAASAVSLVLSNASDPPTAR
jgi:hypothetical protein